MSIQEGVLSKMVAPYGRLIPWIAAEMMRVLRAFEAAERLRSALRDAYAEDPNVEDIRAETFSGSIRPFGTIRRAAISISTS